LDMLEGLDREIAEKFFWLGMKQSQIATECGVTQQAIAWRVKKIRRILCILEQG